MRFHLPALIGQPVLASNSTCAYSQKIRRFAGMMAECGHEVIVYGAPLMEGEHPWPGQEIPYVECREYEEPVAFDGEAWEDGNAEAIYEISPLIEPGDYLLLIAGLCQKAIADAFPDNPAVEFGIGYGGSFANFRVFESYCWMTATYAAQGGSDPHVLDGNAYHAVIPNYFDPADFPIGKGDGGYLLYVGRLIERKGVEVAVNVSRETGIPLYLAGEGSYKPGEHEDLISYIGPIGPEGRAELMGGAIALLSPTQYIEPFGGAAVEAQFCGAPAITTDWGAFCVPLEAEILTKRGWLTYDVVQVGDETLGLDQDTGEVRWTPLKAIHMFEKQPTTEYRNRNWSIRTTKGHRWVVPRGEGYELLPFEEMASEDRIQLAGEAMDGDLPTTPQQAALIGWLLTDGSIETRMRSGKRIGFDPEVEEADAVGKARIWQSKKAGLQAVRKVLEGTQHTETDRANGPGQQPRRVFRVAPGPVRDAFASAQIRERGLSGFVLGLSREARATFLQACIDAEGWQASRGSTILISQNEGPLCDAISLCAYLQGKRPTASRSGERNITVGLCNPVMVPRRLRRAEGRVEDVWCPSTALGTWTMRFNGLISLTGNSETVPQGVSGYRCRRLGEFVWAAEHAAELDRAAIAARARRLYSTAAIAPRYEAYFAHLETLRDGRGGWYDPASAPPGLACPA